MRENFWYVIAIMFIVIMFALLSIVALGAIDDNTGTEIERYSIGMKITHAEESTYYVKHYGAQTTRTFYLRGDDKTMSINVNAETFARFTQGDWVEVEIQITESAIFHNIKEKARIIGAMEN